MHEATKVEPKVLTSKHVFPRTTLEPISFPIPLTSITSLAAPPACALLLYDPTAAAALDPTSLEASLSITLQSYPFLVGIQRTARDDDPGPAYSRRFRRQWIEFGTARDPGMSLVFERREYPLESIFAHPEGTQVLDLETINDLGLQPSLATPPLQRKDGGDGGGSLAGVKVTTFACGSATLCLSVYHTLFDAQALGTFMTDWAAIHRAVIKGDTPSIPNRPVDQAMLDSLASGNLDSENEDSRILDLESHLDVFRYDSWARDPTGVRNPPSSDGYCPDPAVDALDAAKGRLRGPPPPWETLSTSIVQQRGILFSAADVLRIHKSTGTGSVHDAFAAHLWRVITRARGNTGEIDFAMASDDRRRFSPSIPPTSPGCFNVCRGFSATAERILGQDGAAWAATRIRQALDSATQDTLGAWLYRRAHELDPTREMICFAGNTTVVTTNWARSGLGDADFGKGKPAFVHNLVQAFGGYATIQKLAGDGKWYEPGIVVALWLEEEAMSRLLQDPQLHGPPDQLNGNAK